MEERVSDIGGRNINVSVGKKRIVCKKERTLWSYPTLLEQRKNNGYPRRRRAGDGSREPSQTSD